MNEILEQVEPRPDVLVALRQRASHGASVRELVELIQGKLGYGGSAVIPVLWYFVRAFDLPLREVLPIREWLGTTEDEEINALILPAIDRAKERWMQLGQETANNAASNSVKHEDRSTAQHRS
jgi:hypothetical protein